MFQAVKRLGVHSFVYIISDTLTRVVTFVLIAVYTRFLGMQAYGILAVLDMVYSLVFSVSFNSTASVTTYFYNEFSESARRRFFGNLWLLLISQAILLLVVLELIGPTLFNAVLREVPYETYGRYAIWAGLLGIVVMCLPLSLFRASQQPGLYAIFNIGWSLLRIALVAFLIIIWKRGIIGSLEGQLYAVIGMTIPSFIILRKKITVAYSWKDIRNIIVFSFPLVPHFIAAWGLNLSDRAILNNYVSLEELGLYALGHQFGMLLNMVIGSLNTAWGPHFLSIIDDEVKRQTIPNLVTYIWVGIIVTGLGVALLAEPIILIMAGPSFYESVKIVPWIVGGYICLGIGIIPRNQLLYQKKSNYIFSATLVAVIVNIGLNLLLIPRYGIMAAAVDAFIAHFVSLLIVFVYASQARTTSYEKDRVFKILITCLLIYLFGVAVKINPPYLEFIARGVIIMIGIPLSLWVARFYTPQEITAIVQMPKALVKVIHGLNK